MELINIRDAFGRVTKKQKSSSSKSQEVIDQVGREIEQALGKIQAAQDLTFPFDHKSFLTDLKLKLNAIDPLHQLEVLQKEVNLNLSKYQKLLHNFFNPNISKAYRSVDFDFHIMNQIVASHFYREGFFDIGDSILNESGEPEEAELKSQFLELHNILGAVRVRNLEPALKWACGNRDKLKQNVSNLELKLNRLQFLEILEKGTRADALNYARTCLAPFYSLHMEEFQKLMGCLLWVGRLDSSPYSEIASPSHWENLAEELTRQFCSLLGQSYGSPLRVATAAGVEGLPTLLKLANVMAAKQEWLAMKHLPVPVELGKEFQFHYICLSCE